jgi:hypothetical protein
MPEGINYLAQFAQLITIVNRPREEEKMLLKNAAVILVAIWAAVALISCARDSEKPKPDLEVSLVYLKNNIHGQKKFQGDTYSIRASYANWVGIYADHSIIPVNTPVEVGKYRQGFLLTATTDGILIYFEYRSANMQEMPVEDYIKLITSPDKVSLKHLSRIDQKGISDGKAYPGMSKEGVRIALGYPALHYTPSLNENFWTYWYDRFQTMTITFGENGKVKTIQ